MLYKKASLPRQVCTTLVVIHAFASAEKGERVDSANLSSYKLDVLSSQFAGTVEKERLCQHASSNMLVSDFN